MENLQELYLSEDEEKSITWETNHKNIIKAITSGSCFDVPPSITEIARITGLSRKTVYQHLKGCKTAPDYKNRAAMFDVLHSDILMRLGLMAFRGNVKAIKLYLELTGSLKKGQKETHNTINITGYEQVDEITSNTEEVKKTEPEPMQKIINAPIKTQDMDTPLTKTAG